MNEKTLNFSAKVFPTHHQISLSLAGKEVILHEKEGIYFGLNESGTFIWDLIKQGPQSIQSLKEAMAAQFEIADDICEQDIISLLNDLHDEGLVEFAA